MADANKRRKVVRLLPSEKVVSGGSKTPELAAEDHLLSGLTACLTAPADRAKRPAWEASVPSIKPAGTAPKPSPLTLPALFSPGRPLVMGILNVTPDSFSDGGRFLDPNRPSPMPQKWRSRAPTSSISARSPRAPMAARSPCRRMMKRRGSRRCAGSGQARPAGVDRHDQGLDRSLGTRPRRRDRQ